MYVCTYVCNSEHKNHQSQYCRNETTLQNKIMHKDNQTFSGHKQTLQLATCCSRQTDI